MRIHGTKCIVYDKKERGHDRDGNDQGKGQSIASVLVMSFLTLIFISHCSVNPIV